MAVANVSGTPLKAIVYGIPFDVHADCKPTANLSGVKTEASATSGPAVMKRTKQPKYVKGIDLRMSIQDYKALSLMLEANLGSGPMSLVYADRSVLAGTGQIDLGDHDGAEHKASVDVYFDNVTVTAG